MTLLLVADVLLKEKGRSEEMLDIIMEQYQGTVKTVEKLKEHFLLEETLDVMKEQYQAVATI